MVNYANAVAAHARRPSTSSRSTCRMARRIPPPSMKHRRNSHETETCYFHGWGDIAQEMKGCPFMQEATTMRTLLAYLAAALATLFVPAVVYGAPGERFQ